MTNVVPIKPKPRFYMRPVSGLCDGETYLPLVGGDAYRPFCYAHNCWPCGQCGTYHYEGCPCDFCTGKAR